MPFSSHNSLPIVVRRRGRHLAYWNGALWALGNGLASTQLVIYLALELKSRQLGLGIAMILAAPNVVGVLRMAAPSMVDRFGNRKWFCVVSFCIGALLLATLPAVATPGRLSSPGVSLAVLAVLWCIYHLFQYLGTVALWSWLADLVPTHIRGRFLGRRERWMVLGQAGGMLAAGLYAWGWHAMHPNLAQWTAYVLPVVVGVGFMLCAVVPLGLMPRAEKEKTLEREKAPSLFAPLQDWRFRRLLFFGCWFSFFNGITQAAMGIYVARVLLFSVLVMLTLKTFMRLGQWGLSPTAGRLADRFGNRPVLMVSLLLVAQGPLFYLLATPDHRWWIVGAWAVWIAYAGLNVALPNLMLRLSTGESNMPCIATYYTLTGLCYAASTLVGGMLYDLLRSVVIEFPGGTAWNYFACVFFAGWILRMLGAVVLLAVVEPKDEEPQMNTDQHR